MKEHKFEGYRLFHNDDTPNVYTYDRNTKHLYSDNFKQVLEVSRVPYADHPFPFIVWHRTICKNGNRRTKQMQEFRSQEEMKEWMSSLQDFTQAHIQYFGED